MPLFVRTREGVIIGPRQAAEDTNPSPDVDVVGKFRKRLRLTLFDKSMIIQIALFRLILEPSTNLPTTSTYAAA